METLKRLKYALIMIFWVLFILSFFDVYTAIRIDHDPTLYCDNAIFEEGKYDFWNATVWFINREL